MYLPTEDRTIIQKKKQSLSFIQYNKWTYKFIINCTTLTTMFWSYLIDWNSMIEVYEGIAESYLYTFCQWTIILCSANQNFWYRCILAWTISIIWAIRRQINFTWLNSINAKILQRLLKSVLIYTADIITDRA